MGPEGRRPKTESRRPWRAGARRAQRQAPTALRRAEAARRQGGLASVFGLRPSDRSFHCPRRDGMERYEVVLALVPDDHVERTEGLERADELEPVAQGERERLADVLQERARVGDGALLGLARDRQRLLRQLGVALEGGA